MHFTLKQTESETGTTFLVTDPNGRVVGSRPGRHGVGGAVVVASEVSEASVWSWHRSADAARAAATKLRRARPEIFVSAATA